MLAAYPDAACVAVDMPIGLPAGPGGRASDRAAAQLLGRASSRVFPAPDPACLEMPTYAAARLVEPTLSAQSYALRGKILEAEEARHDGPVIEAHPELAFLAFAGRVLVSKRTWDGAVQRRAVLAAEGLVLPDDLGPTGGTAAVDDVLDAAACALVAAAVVDGTAAAPRRPRRGRHLDAASPVTTAASSCSPQKTASPNCARARSTLSAPPPTNTTGIDAPVLRAPQPLGDRAAVARQALERDHEHLGHAVGAHALAVRPVHGHLVAGGDEAPRDDVASSSSQWT